MAGRKKIFPGNKSLQDTDKPVRRNPFEQFKPEEGIEVRKPLPVKKDVNVSRLISLFETLAVIEVNVDEVYSPIVSWGIDIDEKNTYQSFLAQIEDSGIFPTSREIEKFSIIVPEFDQRMKYFEKRFGLFLSAMIELSRDREFVVHVFEEEPEYLCFMNRKNVTIKGNLNNVGINMLDGRITVDGTLNYAGSFSKGGEIHVNGTLKNLPRKGENNFAKIYVNGELVFEGEG